MQLQVQQLTVNCIRTKLKLRCRTNLESGLSSPSPSLVELCAGSNSINALSWSQVNASCACVLVSKIAYDAENACSDHGIWTLSLTFHLGSQMKTLSPCAVIAYPSSVISWISSNMMRIPETWSMNCI